jgi:hypothetical protein
MDSMVLGCRGAIGMPEELLDPAFRISLSVITCGDVCVLTIRRGNLLQTFSNFYRSLHMR